ncbi:MAG: Ig-like domain-containing protein, partial [Oscillospiraceae bacterium]|nr:Ig-like domain-containing protein [Oscillospiraceae bacterium]
MRKTSFRRVLSLVLALVIVVGMLPQTVIFAADGEKTVFGFSSAKYYKTFEDTSVSSLSDGEVATKLADYFKSDGYSRNWKFFAQSWSSTSGWCGYTGGNGLYFRYGQYGDWFSLKVKGFNKGTYDISAITAPQRGCVWGLYVLDNATYGNANADTITTAIVNYATTSGVQKIGEVDLYGKISAGKVDASDSTASTVTNSGNWAVSNFGNAAFSGNAETEYILVFRAEREGTIEGDDVKPTQTSERYISLFGLTFEKVEALKEITAKDISAKVGDKLPDIKSLISWISTSGTAVAGEKVFEEIQISENDGCIIEASDGALYAVKPGSATVKVKGKLATGLGGSKETEVKITVGESSRTFSGEVIDFNFSANAIKASGETPVYYTAADGCAKENTYINIRAMTEYCKTSSPARNWRTYIETSNKASYGYAYMGGGATFIQVPSVDNGFVSFKLTGIPKGNYAIKMAYNYQGRGALLGAYILDNDKYGSATEAEIRAAIANGSEGVQSVGQVDCYGIVEKVNPTYTFGRADFSEDESGEYILVINFEGAGTLGEGETSTDNGSKPYMYFSKVILDGTYVESVETSLTYDKIGVGEETEIIVTKGRKNTGEVISDVSETTLVNYEVVEGTDVLELSSDGKTLTSKKEGTATLETTVIVDGAIVKCRNTVEVSNAYKLESISLSGNTTAYTGKNFRIFPVATMGDGSESIPAGAKITYEVVSGSEYVLATSDGIVATDRVGEASIRVKAEFRGKVITSDAITVYVTDELEALSGETFVYTPEALSFDGKEGELQGEVITVSKEGRYQLTLNGTGGKTSGIIDIWAIPYSEATSANPAGFLFGAYKVGSADLYATASENYDITLPDVVFDKSGDYIIVAKISGKNEASTGYSVTINSIEFDGVSVADKVVTYVQSPKLGAGETTEFTVSAYLSNGREIPLDEAEVSYVYDESLIAVDGEKLTIRTNDGASGSCDVTVKTIYKGYTAEETVTLTIDKKYGVNTDKLAILYGSTLFTIGNTVEFTPAIVLNDQSVVKITDGEIIYKIEENNEGAVEFEDDGKTLKAVAEGTAVVSAMVEFRGNVYESEKVSVSVTANQNENPNIDMYFTTNGNAGESLQYLTDTAGYSANRRWKLQSVAGQANSLQFYDTYGQFLFDPASEDKYIALILNVPGAGTYNITAQSNYCRYRSGRFDMYIAPATSANISNITGNIAPANLVGSMDFYMPGQGTVGEVIDVCKGYEFENGGEYLVILNLVPGNSAALAGGVIKAERGDTMYPTYISFAEVNAMASASLTAEKDVLAPGDSTDISISLKTVENLPIDVNKGLLSVTYRSTDASVATVDENGRITGVAEGNAEIRAVVSYGGVTKNVTLPITVRDSSALLGIELSAGDSSIYVYGSTGISLKAKMQSGNIITVPEEYITWNISEPSFAEIEAGYIIGKAVGSVTVTALVSNDFKDGAESVEIPPVVIDVVWDATVDPAIYTLEERENAINNAKKYSWAKTQVKTAVDNADKYLASFDAVYAMISPEGIPRCRLARHTYDPMVYFCGYCGYNIGENVSIYGWSADPISRPWKIQCPDCKRLFPSNDFGSFYELGLSESKTYWNYLDALQKHHELFVCEDVKAGNECSHTAPAESAPEPGSTAWIAADPRDAEWYEYYGYGVEGGYLTNDIYNEMDAGWGVDDGFGYKQKYVSTPGEIGYHKLYYNDGEGYARYADGTHDGPVQHTYIAYYLHEGIWFGGGGSKSAYVVRKALTAFRDAFLYTGDAKYGRAGAIMLDRIADIYPAFDWYQWHTFRGDQYRGKITDPAWSHHMDELFSSCYDAFLPIYNDRQVIDTLSKRALYKMDENGNYILDDEGNPILTNAKDTPGALRKNVEDGILLETFKSAKEWEVAGNFGSTKKAVAMAAVALNKMPETKEMIDWLM